jgi:hypothetical protein
MADKRPYRLRQAILSALNACFPGGKDLDELVRSGALCDLAAGREETLTEARILESGGYCRDVRGRGRDPWWKITHSGLCQIRKEAVLDEVVWGEEAF